MSTTKERFRSHARIWCHVAFGRRRRNRLVPLVYPCISLSAKEYVVRIRYTYYRSANINMWIRVSWALCGSEKSYRSNKTDIECRLLGAFLHVFQDEKGHELNERELSSRRFLALMTALDIFVVRVESCT